MLECIPVCKDRACIFLDSGEKQLTRFRRDLIDHRIIARGSVVAVVILAVAACMRQPAATPAPQQAIPDPFANGRMIFQTGRDIDGARITAQPPPLYGKCSACHRADGSGGVHFPDGAVSADLRHRALVTQQRHPYNMALLERAISTGIDNDGEKLDRVMPRWKMSARDLHDVAQYVLMKLK